MKGIILYQHKYQLFLRSRDGYGGRCGRVGRPVGKCRSRNRLRQTVAVRRRRGKRFGKGRLKIGFQTTSMLTYSPIYVRFQI